MSFEWNSETLNYTVHVIHLVNDRFTWQLVITDHRGTATVETFEDGAVEFDTPDAAEQAGKLRMVEHARQIR